MSVERDLVDEGVACNRARVLGNKGVSSVKNQSYMIVVKDGRELDPLQRPNCLQDKKCTQANANHIS